MPLRWPSQIKEKFGLVGGDLQRIHRQAGSAPLDARTSRTYVKVHGAQRINVPEHIPICVQSASRIRMRDRWLTTTEIHEPCAQHIVGSSRRAPAGDAHNKTTATVTPSLPRSRSATNQFMRAGETGRETNAPESVRRGLARQSTILCSGC